MNINFSTPDVHSPWFQSRSQLDVEGCSAVKYRLSSRYVAQWNVIADMDYVKFNVVQAVPSPIVR